MSKSFKFKKLLLDSIGIAHKKQLLSDILDSSIVESGENASGSYIKFASGMLITIHQVNQYLERTSEWGSMFETTQPANLGNFPVAFKYTPFIFLTLYNNNALFEAINDATNTTAGKVYIIAPTSNASQIYTIQVLAVGSWK